MSLWLFNGFMILVSLESNLCAVKKIGVHISVEACTYSSTQDIGSRSQWTERPCSLDPSRVNGDDVKNKRERVGFQ